MLLHKNLLNQFASEPGASLRTYHIKKTIQFTISIRVLLLACISLIIYCIFLIEVGGSTMKPKFVDNSFLIIYVQMERVQEALRHPFDQFQIKWFELELLTNSWNLASGKVLLSGISKPRIWNRWFWSTFKLPLLFAPYLRQLTYIWV